MLGMLEIKNMIIMAARTVDIVLDTAVVDVDKPFRRFLPASPKAKAGLGVQSLRPSVRPSVRPSIPKSCHRNSSETTDPIIMKLGM